MSDLTTRIDGVAGRITLTRPGALNALSHPMSLALEAALDTWRDDTGVALVIIDAEGDRAFCAGGDIAAMYHAGRAGDFDSARQFWRDEYRMNAKLFEYRKPVIAFLQGFVMGGGVGIGGHASHRIVGESTKIAMPESGIGLIPDVGWSLLLAQAPGRIGEYLAVTGARMGPGDAIFAGFADRFVPEADWPALKSELAQTGNWKRIADAAAATPLSPLAAHAALIDRCFAAPDLGGIVASLAAETDPFAVQTLATIGRNSPLSMAAGIALVRRMRGSNSIRLALELEFRFTSRAMQMGDFLEGVRAQIIDKDRNPKWKHANPDGVTQAEIDAILAPLGPDALRLEEELA
jgi:enoyl-CoA hydratase